MCALPEPGIVFILWQSRAANVLPDKMIVILGDVGTTNFSPVSQSGDILTAVAIYVEGTNLWISDSGSLSSAVAATGQTCSLPLPLYATGGTCSVATFDEQGAISFAPISDVSAGAAPVNLTIPRETVHGLWQALTGIQPVASIQRTIRLQKLFTPAR